MLADRTGQTAEVQVSAIGVCVAMAFASGAKGLEAAVVLTDSGAVASADLAVLRDLGGEGVVVHRGDPKGTVAETFSV